MDGRQVRGRQIAALGRIKRNRLGWRVPSQANRGHYIVNLDDDHDPFCTCPDFETRHKPCKHIYAVEFMTERRIAPDGTVTETKAMRITYRQDWPAYNAAQTNEKDFFQVLLQDLCKDLARSKQGTGRPRVPLKDGIFSAVFKVYSTLSARRFMSDLRHAREKGHIGRLPCYNSVLNVFDAPETEPVLRRLIDVSALPLKSVESNFAADSSGFGACRFDRWFDYRHGTKRMRRAWVKAHIMCGVTTNVVTALEIHGQNAADSPLLPKLLQATVARFDVREVSADLGYSSEANLQTILDVGAKPFIPFKSNATYDKGGLWARMFHYYNLYRDEFLSRYHQRSNVETTFHMIKSKFGDSVRAKTDRAMRNEVRAKILCHNICCLIQSMYEFGIEPRSWVSE